MSDWPRVKLASCRESNITCGDERGVFLALDEVGDIVHRSRTVEGVHGDKVLEDRWLQLAQVFLHAARLKLERAHGASTAIELVGEGVVDGDGLQVDFLSGGELHVLHGLLEDGECLQSQEVHLDESRLLYHVAVILRAEQLVAGIGLVLSGRYGHPVADGIAADDGAAGMDAGVAHGALEHAGILDGVAGTDIGRHLGIAQFGHAFDGIVEVHLHAVGQTVGDGLAQAVALLQGQLLHPGHVLDGVLRGHTAVGDDMGHLVVPILVLHPLQHTATAVVIEVGVDIGQRDTVGVEEALEQQVILDGVDLGDAQTIGHHRPGRRATPRPHHHVELLARRVDEVLHDEEVAGESHGLHHMQLKLHALGHLLGDGVAIEAARTVVRQLGQVVGLELDAVELVVAAEFLDFLLALLTRHDLVAVLVARELLEELLLGVFAAHVVLGAKLGGDGEEGHDGRMVDGVGLHLVEHLAGVVERLGDVGEHLVHLGAGLQPLLLRVEHARGVVQVLARGEAEQVVVGLGILLVHEMGVVGAHQLHAILPRQLYQHLVGLLLQGEGLAVGADVGVAHLMALQLQVVVVAKHALVPLYGLAGSLDVALENLVGHLAGDAGRAHDEALVVALQLVVVGTRTHVESVYPCVRHELDEVLVALVVLGKHDEVPSALVVMVLAAVGHLAPGHIHLTAEDGLELGQAFLLPLAVHLVAIIEQLLHTEHVAMVGDCDAAHAVANRLVYQIFDARLSVENREVCMYV